MGIINQIMNIEINHYIPIIILAIFAICMIEYALHSSWNLRYFTTGITCFRIKRKFTFSNLEIPVAEFESQFKGRHDFLGIPIIPSILFNKLDSDTYAFREKSWFPSLYLPIMRGLIILSPDKSNIVYKAKLNYIPPILFLVILPAIFGISFPDKESWTLFVPFFLISMGFQSIRYIYISIHCHKIINKFWLGNAQQKNKADAKSSAAY